MDYLNSFREMISLRGLTNHTIKSYATYISAYLKYLDCLGITPETASWDIMRDFITSIQKERSLSDRTINAAFSQLRFFTLYILHKPWDPYQLPLRRFDLYLPFVPTKEEVRTFISAFTDLKQKAMLVLMYSAGLRVGEVCHLRYEDISRSQMRIHVTHGKNRSDRYAILSPVALDILTQYWFAYGKPTGYLFPKQNGQDKPIDTFSLADIWQQWKNLLAGRTALHAIPSAMLSEPIFMKTALTSSRSKSSWVINPFPPRCSMCISLQTVQNLSSALWMKWVTCYEVQDKDPADLRQWMG